MDTGGCNLGDTFFCTTCVYKLGGTLNGDLFFVKKGNILLRIGKEFFVVILRLDFTILIDPALILILLFII